MAEDMLLEMQQLDPRIVANVAGRSLNIADFKLADWSVEPLRHEAVLETTGGLFRFRGHGWDGAQLRAWSAVLKLVNQPAEECLSPQDFCYWRRELLAYQSGLLAALPEAIHAPRCFGILEQPPGAWLWLEDIEEAAGQDWGLDQYQVAARRLGQLAGAYLTGAPVPQAPWLCPSLFREFYADSGWWSKFTDPASANNAWQRPLVQAVYPEPLRARVLRLWAEKWSWIAANERLPQVFCHNDAHRRNLMLRGDQLVAIDWAFCGPGRVGNDLGELVGTSLSYFAVDPAHAVDLETAVLAGYAAGLREAGWTGDLQLARLGYLISLALYWGGTLCCEIALAQPEAGRVNVEAKYGRPAAALVEGWTQLAEFSLDRTDEARFLVKQMAF